MAVEYGIYVCILVYGSFWVEGSDLRAFGTRGIRSLGACLGLKHDRGGFSSGLILSSGVDGIIKTFPHLVLFYSCVFLLLYMHVALWDDVNQ